MCGYLLPVFYVSGGLEPKIYFAHGFVYDPINKTIRHDWKSPINVTALYNWKQTR